MKYYGIIYKHQSKTTGKVYIGQTIQKLSRRFRPGRMLQAYKTCPPFYNALLSHGEQDFITEILISCFDRESLNQAEEYFINLYNSVAPNGYNSTMVIDNIITFTPEIRKKISDKQKESFRKRKESGIEIISSTRKKHQNINGEECKYCGSCQQYKPIKSENYCLDKNSWDGYNRICKQCIKQKGYNVGRYIKVSEEQRKQSILEKNQKIGQDLKKRYKEDNEFKEKAIANIKKANSIPVVGVDVKTGQIFEFTSASEIEEKFGIFKQRISESIKNKKPYKGIQYYKKEEYQK